MKRYVKEYANDCIRSLQYIERHNPHEEVKAAMREKIRCINVYVAACEENTISGSEAVSHIAKYS